MYLSQQHNDLNRYIKDWVKSFFPESYIKDEAFMFNWSTIQLDQKAVMDSILKGQSGHGYPQVYVNFDQLSQQSNLSLLFPTNDTNHYLTDPIVTVKTKPYVRIELEAFYKPQSVPVNLTIISKEHKESLLLNEMILNSYPQNFKSVPHEPFSFYETCLEVGSLIQSQHPDLFDYLASALTAGEEYNGQLRLEQNLLDDGNIIMCSPFRVEPLIKVTSSSVEYNKADLESKLVISMELDFQMVYKLGYKENYEIKEIVFIVSE
jgi:hypothetical protein